MGKRGPPPKPRALKVVQGTLRKDREPESPVELEPGIPEPPEGMGDEARRCWDRLVPVLVTVRILTVIDREALVMLCNSWAHYWYLQGVVEEEGFTYTSAKGNVLQHPAVSSMNKALENCLRLAREFGLTPASRSRIEALPKPPEDPSREFLFGK